MFEQLSHSMDLASQIDHTVLGPEKTAEDVSTLVDQAEEYGMNICVPPRYVAYADSLTDSRLATVIGFPNGTSKTSSKVFEAEEAFNDGADEIDMVAHIGDIKSGDLTSVQVEVEEVVRSVNVPVKVIVESHLLSETKLRDVCEACKDANADFVKTSTGFSDGGAEVRDVEVMSEYLPVKASGGVSNLDEALQMIEAGAERIGASSGHEIMREYHLK